MKQFKKLLAILLCAVMVIGLFAGCQSKDKPEDSSASSSTSSTEKKEEEKKEEKKEEPKKEEKKEEPKKEEPKKEEKKEEVVEEKGITYTGVSPVFEETKVISWIGTNGSSLTFEWDKMDWCHEICRVANVELEMEMLENTTYNDVINPRLAAGADLPDVVQMPSKDEDMKFIKSGLFAELTSYYDDYGYNLAWRFEDNPTVKGQLTTPDGKIFYVPVVDMSTDYCPAPLLNFTWTSELGFDVPKTTDEYYELLKAMKGADLNGNGEDDEWPLFLRAGMETFMGSMWGLDLRLGYYNNDGTVEASYINDRYLDYLTYMNKLYTEGLLYNEWSTSTYDIQNKLFSNNQVGSGYHYTNNCQSYCRLIDGEWKNDGSMPLTFGAVEPYTTAVWGKKELAGLDPIAGVFGISKFCEKPDEVFCFLDFLYSEEANNLLYYGIEGVDYKVENGRKILDTERRSTNNYASVAGNNMGAFPRILLAEHRDNAYVPEIGERNAAIRQFYKIPIGFAYALEDELETVKTYATDLSTYWGEMRVAFITGTRPLSEYDDYVNTLKNMHIDDMAAVYQAKSDRIG